MPGFKTRMHEFRKEMNLQQAELAELARVRRGVINLKNKQKILLKHIGGFSNREIAGQLNLSKDTVNKYVNEYERQKAELMVLDPDADPAEIISDLVAKPTYDTSNRTSGNSTEKASAIP